MLSPPTPDPAQPFRRDGDPFQSLVPQAIAHWADTDPIMALLARRFPPVVRPARRQSAFAALATAITYQQVSLAAGRAIWTRFEERLDGRVTPAAVLAHDDEHFATTGLSRQKRAYVRAIAQAFEDGEVTPRRFRRMSDDEIIDQLVAVKGIGTWTAKMFLMFHLHRPDVLAPEDLGLRLGVARFYEVPEPDAWHYMEEHGEAWRPYASIAARVLWDARHETDEDPGRLEAWHAAVRPLRDR